MESLEDQVRIIQAEIIKQIEDKYPVEFRIPGWKPIGLEEAFHWIKATMYEGYDLKYRIDFEDEVNIVSLLKWELGENEPEFFN